MSIEGFAHELMNSKDLDGQTTLSDHGVDNSCDLVMLCGELEDIANVVIHPGEIAPHSTVCAVRVLIETRRAANLRMSVSPVEQRLQTHHSIPTPFAVLI